MILLTLVTADLIPNNNPRTAPSHLVARVRDYDFNTRIWNVTHYGLGFTSAALATLLAAQGATKLLTSPADTLAASIAAGLAFLVTTLDGRGRAERYDRAANVLRTAITRYELDDSVPLKYLADANDQASAILNSRDQTPAPSPRELEPPALAPRPEPRSK